VQLNQDGTVSGPNGATCSHVRSEWEVSIPKADLPTYEKTLDFGLYSENPFITGISNLDSSDTYSLT
jgi:hypothetical protein